ncbi:tail completion protein gp17 [Cohaesibacter gelatinilyticus]|uniref:DUF3168 domain-containing protein n=1 Tax=Cohaesibacter gelatinilyticus TaxID=372072 RepID=A0A285PJ28_9HYPH|nr:Protein of unknown function [Cohaesibacter gelatinilyticus]
MPSYVWNLQKAIYDAIVTAAAPEIEGGRVTDEWHESPEQSFFPYVFFQPENSLPNNASCHQGSTRYWGIHIYSRSSSNSELSSISGRIWEAFDGVKLSVSGLGTAYATIQSDTDVSLAKTRGTKIVIQIECREV